MQSCTCEPARVSCRWQRPSALHLAGLHRLRTLTKNLHTIKQRVATLQCYIYTRDSIWKREIYHHSNVTFQKDNSFSLAKSLFFQTRLIAIKILRMTLAVTNAASYWKRADIVFFLWHDLWDFIIFWWITVYPECEHDVSLRGGSSQSSRLTQMAQQKHLIWLAGSEHHQRIRKVSGSGLEGGVK